MDPILKDLDKSVETEQYLAKKQDFANERLLQVVKTSVKKLSWQTFPSRNDI
jgi:hypothetical protein